MMMVGFERRELEEESYLDYLSDMTDDRARDCARAPDARALAPYLVKARRVEEWKRSAERQVEIGDVSGIDSNHEKM